MKKYVIIILSALFIIMSLSACGADQPETFEGRYVMTKTPDDYNSAQEIIFFKNGTCTIVYEFHGVHIDNYSFSLKNRYVSIGTPDNPGWFDEVFTLSNDGKTLTSESWEFQLDK